MPSSGSYISIVEQKMGKLPSFVIYAILEWVMIVFLFIEGILAFISSEFAKFFELKVPCLLCTRIDHVFYHRNSNCYYNDSICEIHKIGISSLAYCHVHKKLSDIRNMCEGCLLSFAMEKDSDMDKYKSIVGILHKDVDGFTEEDKKILMRPLRKDDVELLDEKSGVQWCSCCGERLKFKSSAKYKRNMSMNAPTSSPRAPLFGSKMEEGRNVELSHIKYTELKFMSDTESEVQEDEEAENGDNHGIKEDIKAASVPLLPDTDYMNADATRTPIFTRGNRFFGAPLTDSAQVSPRWTYWSNKRMPNDKMEFTNDPNDTNELDSDIMNRLNKQVRLDRKSLLELYMELDEERSASAVAANNAMAMITRLQAEKAAVQMEALQYQRMMEEQAEYDQEAIQVTKDMLLKREEDVKALENELEMYREKYGRMKNVGSEICEVDAEDNYQDIRSGSMVSFSEMSDGDYNSIEENERSMEYEGWNSRGSLLDFDRDRSFLLSLLSNLEKQIHSPVDGLNSFDCTIKHEDMASGNENKATLTREVSLFRERLRAIEADSGFLKHAAMTLQRGEEGTKLLTEIDQNLRKLRQTVKPPTENTDA